MTTAQALVESLLRHGIDTVYGLPGVHNDDLFDAFHGAKDRLRVLHTRHEQAAGYMALGAALATGKPQAFAVVPGPGLLNAGGALITAYGMNAPVLALVGQIPQAEIDRAHGYLHEIPDQLGLARHFSKFAARIRAPHQAPFLVRDALNSATSGRQRPAVLECAIDMWGRKGAVSFPAMPAPVPKPPIDHEAASRAAKLLGAAKRPLMVVGGGAQDASAEVMALAEMLEAPVVSYRRGRGVVPSSHRLSVNLPIGHRLWKEADAVLAVGTRLHIQHREWGVDPELAIVRIDIDPEEPDRFRKPAVALVGDAAGYLAELLNRLPAHNVKRPTRTAELEAHRAWLAEQLGRLGPQMSFLRAIRASLPEQGIFVDEVTQMGFVARLAFPIEYPRTFLSPGYQDTLGWGYGVALGAKAARPDLPLVAIAGDGGFMYQVGELATAVRHKLAVVSVIFDNGLFENVRRTQQERFGGRVIASDLANPDFVRLAESFGVAGFRAETAAQLETAIREALSLGAPALVHVPCGPMPSPWSLIQMERVRG
ncbi:MAG: TPP-binding protein [Chloroflexota bacterium]|nr:TPP-binding protein [Chloroflexota bacterium]